MIINPSSASASKGDSWKDFLKILTDGGLEVEPLLTERPAHAIELAQKAAEGGVRQFIAVGGDGTIHEVMTGLLRYSVASGTDMGEFTLGVIPYGTGKDFRSSRGPDEGGRVHHRRQDSQGGRGEDDLLQRHILYGQYRRSRHRR